MATWIRWSLQPDSEIVLRIALELDISAERAFTAISKFVWIAHRYGKPYPGYIGRICAGYDYIDTVCCVWPGDKVPGLGRALSRHRIVKLDRHGHILIKRSPLFPRLQTPADIRYSRIKGARRIGRHTKAEWDWMLGLVASVCPRCMRPYDKLTKDHVTPIRMGGSDAIENIQPLCQPCNSGKGDECVDWLAVRGLREQVNA